MKKKLLTIFLVTIIASIELGSTASYALLGENPIPINEEGYEQEATDMESLGLDPTDNEDKDLYSEYKEDELNYKETGDAKKANLSAKDAVAGKKADLTIDETAKGVEAGLSVEDAAKAKAENLDPKDYKAMQDKLFDPNDEADRQTYMNEKKAAEDQAKLDNEHKDLKNMTFDVGEILNTEGSAKQDYFNEKNPIVSLILRIIDFATTIMGSIAIIILIVAGFMFMFAQGKQQQLDEAKEVIKYALIGLALTFFSYIITIFIQSMFIS